MKTRQMGYADYGFDEKEDKKLKAYCTRPEFEDQILLFHACLEANRYISAVLYFSIANGVSYEDLDRIKYVPISKGDFYGWQRKAMSLFRDMLIMNGKWK